ncbi:MAG: gamma-glutamyltransferase [Solirubrobacterales bacterium]
MSERRGVVAAGHPLTAEAGAQVLREGGNAVDAAVCAVLTSFVCESYLTGFGAGGFMMIHAGGETTLTDFFVAAGGADGARRTAELVPIPVYFDETPQIFNCGAASCGVPGNPAGIENVWRRWGSLPMDRLAEPGVELGRTGVRLTAGAEYFHEILHPILVATRESAALYTPDGRQLVEGDTFHYPEMADALERFAADGADPFYRGEVARQVCDWVRDRGGTLGMDDMAAYEPIQRRPVSAAFRGHELLTNPPPSSGGILIGYSLGLLERLGPNSGVEQIVAAMEAANARRSDDFHKGLHDQEYVRQFLAADLDAVAARIQSGEWAGGVGGAGGPDDRPDRIGSTTHIAVLDADGNCASVTCSNGTGSGVIVPGTGVHLNNMLGEEDLNPQGFHRIPPGQRVSSMMSPTLALRDGEVVLGLGSAGSNRIRSAILQTTVRVLEQAMDAEEAVVAGRLHFEAGTVQAEPGVAESGLSDLERRGVPVVRWKRKNLYFGGVQAVLRDTATGELSGGGDPRRGGAVAFA